MTTGLCFSQLDTQLDIQWPKVIYKNIAKKGYSYISECIYYEYYEKKKNLRQVGQILGTADTTTLRWMKTLRFERRPWGGPARRRFKDPKEMQKMREVHASGVGVKKLARMFDCSHTTARKVVRGKYCVPKME